MKLDHEGTPIMGDNASEVHVEYEVVELGNLQPNWEPGKARADEFKRAWNPETKTDANDGMLLALLRKVR